MKVADGYARNYLLPRKLALLVTEGNKKQIERERAKFDAKEADEKRVVEAIAERLAGVEVVIARRVGETDALYGSVTAADIVEALNAKGFDIDKRKLQLAEPHQEDRRAESPGEAAPRRDRRGHRESRRRGHAAGVTPSKVHGA